MHRSDARRARLRGLALLLAVVASPAWAERWVEIASHPKLTVRADTTSVREVDGERRVWLLYNYTKAESLSDGTTWLSRKSLQSARCDDRTLALVTDYAYTQHDGLGTSPVHVTFAKDERTYSDVVPDTVDERILDFACNAELPAAPKKAR